MKPKQRGKIDWLLVGMAVVLVIALVLLFGVLPND